MVFVHRGMSDIIYLIIKLPFIRTNDLTSWLHDVVIGPNKSIMKAKCFWQFHIMAYLPNLWEWYKANHVDGFLNALVMILVLPVRWRVMIQLTTDQIITWRNRWQGLSLMTGYMMAKHHDFSPLTPITQESRLGSHFLNVIIILSWDLGRLWPIYW